MSAISSLALTLAACGSAKDANKSNFSKAIQAYLDTQKGVCAAIPVGASYAIPAGFAEEHLTVGS
ncbi:hypothetical protein L490_0251 [Bordetella bronchiseptica 00-P-2796]|uniref:Lipoprotein n=1 Tax=Bordetella bronchiseptica 00-P-2796 TaxID=1331199 RepID=A0ABR4R9W1_BORBO|nr:hypothetical protein L490_0251 [Bordetella bronchiseptica 00-P-2796]